MSFSHCVRWCTDHTEATGVAPIAEDAAVHMLLHDASLSALCQLVTDMGLVCLAPLTVARALCASADQVRCLFERHLKSASEHMLRAQHSTVQAVALLLRQKPHQVCVAASADGLPGQTPACLLMICSISLR